MEDTRSEILRVAANRLAIIEECLRINNTNMNTRDRMGLTPLHNASAAGDSELVALLLNNGATIDSLDDESNTPLHVACSNGHFDIVKLLVENGANVHSKNRDRFTPLLKASQQGYDDIEAYLLENGASFSTPLSIAAQNGNHVTVARLLKNNEDVDPVLYLNDTPLFRASQRGHVRVVKILLDYGASIDRECLEGPGFGHEDIFPNTALEVAAHHGNRDVVALLLKRGAKIANSMTTALHHAAFGENLEICQDLIAAGADVNAEDAYGQNSLHCARSAETVSYLVSQGVDVHKKNKKGMSPLHTVCRDSDEEVEAIVAMLEEGLSVHGVDCRGQTPLHVAAMNGYVDYIEPVKVLLEWGADIHSRDNRGRTPLHIASRYGAFKIVKLLIASGSDINIMSFKLLSAFDYAELGKARFENRRAALKSIIVYLVNHVKLMKSVNMYLRPNLLKNLQSEELDKQCQDELELLKTTYIGDSDITYYKFLGKDINQIVWTLNNPKIHEALKSGWFKTEFPNFGILIGNHFNKGIIRKQLTDRVFENCSEVFSGLLEECVHKILSFLSNKELSNFADSNT